LLNIKDYTSQNS